MRQTSWLLVAGLLEACSTQRVPHWTAPQPDETLPLAGYEMVEGVETFLAYGADLRYGTYNHAAMLDYHQGRFLLAWKNGNNTEDKAGQRILYSQSLDGANWTKTDGHNILFPDMNTPSHAAAMFVGPPVHIRGRLYVGASPGTPTDAAAGAQFCLWPDPVNLPASEGGRRNCGPPGYKQDMGTLLMREVLPDKFHSLGLIFWASRSGVPSEWAEASEKLGFKTINEMDSQTQADVATLGPEAVDVPCPTAADGSLKCEACSGGCQVWDSIPKSTQQFIGNERAHYVVPNSSNHEDVIFYRSGKKPILYATVRQGTDQKGWSPPVETNIPNDESNINAGALPGGLVYLVSNACPESKKSTELQLQQLRFRDPVTIAISGDGYNFSSVKAVMSCTALSNTSKCRPRFGGGGKNPGPSYPQGLAVVSPAPAEIQGFYMVATNNKEDVWVAKVPFASLGASQMNSDVPAPKPAFDGKLRASAEDPDRVDAWLEPPSCPPGISACKNSSNHCASLEVLSDDSLALSWFSGYREGWDQTGIVISHLAKASKSAASAPASMSDEQWSIPSVVSRTHDFSTQNPVLFHDNGTLWLFHTRQPSKSRLSSASDPVPNQESVGKMWVTSSPVSGSSWSWTEPEVFDGQNGTWGRNSIIKRLDGSWLIPVYNESLKTSGHQFETSMLFHKPAAAPMLPFRSSWDTVPFNSSGYLVQPSVIRLRTGEPYLRAFFRDRRAQWIYTATSDNDGITWSEPVATDLPNNNAGIHATVLSPSGAVAVVYNNMAGQTKGNLRNHLAVSLSDDGGMTFPVTRALEDHSASASLSGSDVGSEVSGVGPTTCDCYSYPVMTQSQNGWIHFAYTWQRRTIKYTRVTEKWIRGATAALLI